MAITVTPVVNGRRGGLGMLTFAFVYFKTESTQCHHSVLAFCFHLTSTDPPKCSAALQWELPGSACAGPSLHPHPQVAVHCCSSTSSSRVRTAMCCWDAGWIQLPQDGELGSCSRDGKWTCVLISSLERAAVTDQLLRKPLEQLLQIFAGFDFTVTASAFHVVY